MWARRRLFLSIYTIKTRWDYFLIWFQRTSCKQTTNQQTPCGKNEATKSYLPVCPACTRPDHPTEWKKSRGRSTPYWPQSDICLFSSYLESFTGQTHLFGSFPSWLPCTFNLVWHNAAPPCVPLPGGGFTDCAAPCAPGRWKTGGGAKTHIMSLYCLFSVAIILCTYAHTHTFQPMGTNYHTLLRGFRAPESLIGTTMLLYNSGRTALRYLFFSLFNISYLLTSQTKLWTGLKCGWKDVCELVQETLGYFLL